MASASAAVRVDTPAQPERTPAAVGNPNELPGYAEAFRSLLDDRGDFTLASVHPGGILVGLSDGSVRNVLDEFARQAASAMRLGAYGEHWMELPGVDPVDPSLPAVQSPFNFDTLEMLTRLVVPEGQLQRALLVSLKQAEDADGKDLIEISIGADDGRKAGHPLEVYRGNTYLGRIVIFKTGPDRAVGRIQKDLQRGQIKRGDRVTTKFS